MSYTVQAVTSKDDSEIVNLPGKCHHVKSILSLQCFPIRLLENSRSSHTLQGQKRNIRQIVESLWAFFGSLLSSLFHRHILT